MLRTNFFDSEQVAAIVRDYRKAGLEPAEEALMAFAEKVLNNSSQVQQEDIDNLRKHGFSDEDIFNIALTATSRSFFSRVVDAVGFQPPPDWLEKTENLLGKETYKALKIGRTYGQEE